VPGRLDHPRAPDQADQRPGTDGRDRPAEDGRPRVQDSAVRADRPDAPSSADEVRHPGTQAPAKDGGWGGYDADAQFKHPVPKPPGYLPDDTGGSMSTRGALRERGDGGTEPSRPYDPVYGIYFRPVRAPRPQESTDGDRGDAPRATIDRPAFRDPLDDQSPDRYGDPLARPDGTRVPCLDGPPRREQTRQGWAGDCGIIAALGAVAANKPDEITRRVRLQDDGSYQVTLSEARESGGVTEPTGRDIELTVTPELPVKDDDPGTPAGAKIEEDTAWCAIFEKAFAGIDQTWTAEQRNAWVDEWADLCAKDKADDTEPQRSDPAPTGYARLSQGTTPWERAEVLTQLTGQPALVREFPAGQDEWLINRIIRAQLTDGKPILVGSRRKTHEREELPHRLEAEHVYEVTGVEKGKIILRNPWNYKHPEPMETDEFARNMGRFYTTLM
jgi:hypothetical protein